MKRLRPREHWSFSVKPQKAEEPCSVPKNVMQVVGSKTLPDWIPEKQNKRFNASAQTLFDFDIILLAANDHIRLQFLFNSDFCYHCSWCCVEWRP